MTRRTLAIGAALVAAAVALAGCSGGSGPNPTAGAGTETSEPAGSTAPAQPAPTTSASPGSTAPSAGTALIGMLGTADDPDAFEIAITDESGSPVTSLPAGDYTLTFADRSSIHNFRLSGPGEVDVATDVGAVDESTVELTLEPGTYSFVCDPHPSSMSGQLEVTG